MAYTDNAKAALTFAKRMAKTTGQNYIGTEHILLGLLKQQSGVAAKILQNHEETAILPEQSRFWRKRINRRQDFTPRKQERSISCYLLLKREII